MRGKYRRKSEKMFARNLPETHIISQIAKISRNGRYRYGAAISDHCKAEGLTKREGVSLGHTVYLKNMHIECETAKGDPAKEMQFRRDFLCQWTNAEVRWIPLDKYDKGNTPFDPKSLAGRMCFGGLDLASTDDIAAFVLVFPPVDGDPYYYILPHFWTPYENMLKKSQNFPYDRWARQGYLNTTDGNIIHYDFIEREIEKLGEIYNIVEVAFDEWGAIQMAQNLEKQDFRMIRFRQGFKSLSPPSKELYRLILDEKIRHGGHPVLRWMAENVYIETDAAGGIKPSKKKSQHKIDGVIAAVMALDLTIRHENRSKSRGGIVVYDPETDTVTRNGEIIDSPKKKETAEEKHQRELRSALWDM